MWSLQWTGLWVVHLVYICVDFSHLILYDVGTIWYIQVNLPKGYGYVEFKTKADAEKAHLYMDGVSFTYSKSLII